ncbi:hypothetical protein BOX15_Mlig031578g3 [Macrostomum lignano]|uniref:Uncharacterized protein n=2 Tax=Macrostomum lignano TaxID=282301 RepID=A0A267H0R0_9PLAT|nr:hypothetical protein BOX15_Mlig031578g1 [Macrostomum lignano]PAA91880.1 hypothetical protein BOX15_Mlig031578g3 [Macrostomum lignano]
MLLLWLATTVIVTTTALSARIRREIPPRVADASGCLNVTVGPGETLRSLSVYFYSGEGYYIRDGCIDPNATAFGYFADGVNATGWDRLEVTVSAAAAYTDNDQDYIDKNRAAMFAAGLVEGLLTSDRIEAHFVNLADTIIPKGDANLTERLRDWLDEQADWAQNFSDSNPQDAMARNVGYLLAQFQGLINGFSLASTSQSPKFVLHFINAAADSSDVLNVLTDRWPDWKQMGPAQFAQFVARTGHCTALIRLLPGLEDLLAAHNTWNAYSATLRSFKHYDFRLDNDTSFVGGRQSFGGYPGTLASLDAFYVLNDRMLLLQTTNSVFNKTLFKSISPRSLLAWQRVRAANQLAETGQQWAKQFSRFNSGTYNNQYMLVDLNKFKRNASLDNGALTIVEQIPGLVRYSDQTAILRTGYWPSYNVPFHQDVYQLSGYPEVVKKFGLDYSYQLAPRAKILRRDAVNQAGSLDGMRRLMRSSRYRTDPYSERDPCKCLCCRGDLLTRSGSADSPAAFGCYDAKVTSSDLLSRGGTKSGVWAISGPTVDDGRLKPFSWASFGANVSHTLLPGVYNFSWVLVQPRL